MPSNARFSQLRKKIVIALVLALLSGSAFGQAFINEIHYDNDGTDTGEAVEIAGAAGTDLTGWSLVLYNGSTSVVYDADSLGGAIPDLGGGFGVVVVNYPSNGLQNGSPDGIALVDASDNVIQFLSYEGTFTAVGGPADGLTSVDIGVSESSSTPVGHSLQLTGTGAQYSDFSWSAAQANTFGSFNAGQSFGGPVLPQLDLNEIVISTPGTDWEFVELTGTPGTDLSDVAFLVVDRFGVVDGSFDMTGLIVPPSGFFTAASPAAEAQYGFTADLAFADNFLTNNTSSYLLVYEFGGTVGDDLDADDDGVLDVMPWTAVLSEVAFLEAQGENTYAMPALGPDGSFLPAGGLVCDGTWQVHIFGTVATDGTPGAENRCGGDVVINEIHADPDSTLAGDANGDGVRDASDDEFIEIVNVSGVDLDLGGWTLSDGVGVRHTFAAGTVIAADCSVVVFGGGQPAGPFGFGVVQTASSGSLGLNNGGDTVTLSDGVGTVASYSYGSEGGSNQSLTRDPDVSGPEPLVQHSNASGSGGSLYSPGTRVDGSLFSGCEVVFSPRLIHEVQGSGATSPELGAYVAIEGIVVGDFQDGAAGTDGDLNGFFVQEEDSDADGDSQTSEGIFVFDGSAPAVNVEVGDRVRVEGQVAEFFELTEIAAPGGVTLLDSGNPLPTPAQVSLPVSQIADFEAFEGMSVVFPQELFVSGNFTLARFGEVDLAVGGPLDTPTNVVAPGAPAIALQAANDLRRIQLDDGSTVQNPLPLPPYLGDGNTLRVGDSTTGLTGVLSYGFGNYEVHPTQPVEFARLNERPVGPPALGSALATVAGFNVLNYFTTLDDGTNDICGPAGDQECRGADSVAEFQRQKDKLLAALSILDADVVGLIEIENAPDDAPVADLVAGLNDIVGPGSFDYIPTGAIGSDAIRLALIYQPAAVSPLGDFAVLDSTVDPDFLDTRNRPALAQTFQDNVGGEVFTVVVNHLKSKGSDCNDLGDVDTGDGQGNCNGVRTMAAQALVDWLASDPTASGDPDFLIIGDLNAYAQEDPIVTLENGGYVDLIEALVGSGWADGAYSYSFEAQAGYLDHALASASLAPAVGGAATWHINADEPAGLDYNEFNQPGLYTPDEFRSSDHDAVVVALFSDDDEDGVWNDLDVCPGTAIPESAPERELNPNHFALVDGDLLFDTAPLNGEGPGDAFDIFDTAGCSCEQIVEAWSLGKGHLRFGCSVDVMREWVEAQAAP